MDAGASLRREETGHHKRFFLFSLVDAQFGSGAFKLHHYLYGVIACPPKSTALQHTDSLQQSNSVDQFLESRVGAEGIKHRLRSQKEDASVEADLLPMLVGLLQPIEGTVLVSQAA
jgi:hypothetical protein